MYSKLEKYLKSFSQEKLRSYLGKELIDQLLTEWNSDLLTKKRLAEMILQLNGLDILKDPSFRKDILLHMKQEEIEDIFSMLPSSKKTGCDSIEDKADAISSIPWNSSAANLRFIQYFDIDPALFNRVDEDTISEITHQSGKRFFELLDYQFIIRQQVLYELNKSAPLKRMLIHMPTGTGKTKTTMHTIVHYYNFVLKKQGAIIWLAHTTELLQQAYDTFSDVWSHLGEGQVTAYKLWGKHDLNNHKDSFNGFIFCGIQKLISIKQNRPEFLNQLVKDARLIVFDEAHKAAAAETKRLVESFMKIPDGAHDRSLIGLTATPGRTTLTSDENKLLSNMFENRMIGIDINVVNQVNMPRLAYLNDTTENDSIKYLQEASILARIRKEQLTYPDQLTADELKKIKVKMMDNGYTDFSKQSLELIGRKQSRNKAILDKLRYLYTEHIPTIVFACSVVHAKLLSFMLSLEEIPNGLVLGELNSIDRANAINAFKDVENPVNILINYEVLTTGFDATNIRCVLITRPTQSIVLYSQMLGRGLRGPMMGGNQECLLIDIKDNLGEFDTDMAYYHFDAYWN